MDASVQPQVARLPKAISNLPPFPAVAIRALRMASTSDERLRELHDLVSTDPVFSAEILRFANSPLYGISTEVKNTLQASILLGYERVRGLVLTIGMRIYLRPSPDTPVLRACWLHSLACAILCEEFSCLGNIDKDLAYTAGVIHDIGQLALIAAHSKEYQQLVDDPAHSAVDLLQRERELFGIDHCQAGGSLVAAWHLPMEFLEATSQHHQQDCDGKFDLTAVVALSCEMADALGFGLVSPAKSPSCEEILGRVPEHEQLLLPSRSAELAARIASKIKCIEAV